MNSASHYFPREKLIRSIGYLLERSPFYKRFLQGCRADDLATLEGFREIPFTTKNMFSEFNEEFFCTPLSESKEVVKTSGTTGIPLCVRLTRLDLKRLASIESRTFEAAGMAPGTDIAILVNMENSFLAGLAYQLGAEKAGLKPFRIGGLSLSGKVELLRKKGIFAAISPAPQALDLLAQLAQEKISLRKLIIVGDAIRENDFGLNALGRRLRDGGGGELFSNYGMTEMVGSCCECVAGKGTHVHEDFMHVEILREDGSPSEDGEQAEVVITTLGLEGTPLLRYRTGDIATSVRGKCECGRTGQRLGPIQGRMKNVLKIAGVTLTAENIVASIRSEWDGEFCLEVGKNQEKIDQVTVVLDSALDKSERMEIIRRSILNTTRISPPFRLENADLIRSMILKMGGRKGSRILHPGPEKA